MSAATVATAVRERPILFSGPMVKAILDGRKTQTRRILNERDMGSFLGAPGQGHDPHCWGYIDPAGGHHPLTMRYGDVGDRLWVRETWQCFHAGTDLLLAPSPRPNIGALGYAATDEERARKHGKAVWPGPWRPSIFMPRWACRLLLEVTEVRVQRLQEITPDDACAEGFDNTELPPASRAWLDEVRAQTGLAFPPRDAAALHSFGALWDSINGKRAPWSSNPWVWCISFRLVP